MKGHIRQRGEKSWSLILDLGRGEDGKRRQKWLTVHGGKRDAQRELNRLLHEMDTGTFVEPKKVTVGEYLEQWLADYARPTVSAKSYERYAQIVRDNLIPGLGHYPLAKLQPIQIQGFYSAALQAPRKD